MNDITGRSRSDETEVCMAVSAQISGRHVFVGKVVLMTSRSSE